MTKNKLAQLNSALFNPLNLADYLAGADPLRGIQPGRLIFGCTLLHMAPSDPSCLFKSVWVCG